MSPFEHVLIDKFFFPSREERNCEHVFENDETLFQALGSRAKRKKKKNVTLCEPYISSLGFASKGMPRELTPHCRQ